MRRIAYVLLAVLAVSSSAAADGLSEKLNAYIECSNRISGRAYESRQRYFSWTAKSGPTGKEKVIYGTYTIYDTANCAKGVAHANSIEPRVEPLETAAAVYVAAVTALEPLLKEADDYYTQGNYKDDKMAKGKAMHPKLVAAWNAFEAADKSLSVGVEAASDAQAVAKLAEIEKTEGRKAAYHIQSLMMSAKRLVNLQTDQPKELARITAALQDYETIVKATEQYAASGAKDKIGSSFVGASKTFLVSSKNLMRRVRDNVPYNQGEQMILRTGQGAWMVEGSPARLTRDYNQLIDSFNRDPAF